MPIDLTSSEPFSAITPPMTFMGVPFGHDLTDSKAAILGIPFDCGTHPTRIGARYGPNAIREQSALVRPFQPPFANFNPLQVLTAVDCGNANVTPSVIDESFERIEAAVAHIAEADAISRHHGRRRRCHPAPVARPAPALSRPGGGSTSTRIPTPIPATATPSITATIRRPRSPGQPKKESSDTANSIHVGPRGTVTTPGVFDHTRDQGYELIDGEELYARGFADVLAHIHERLAGRPVYLCFDMDFFDPSCAPGVCTPTWGGASAREGLTLLHGLAGLNFVAFDVNTVSPPHDVGGMTAFLAGTVMLECLALACRKDEKSGS